MVPDQAPEKAEKERVHQISPPSISLPKGGGAIRGIGEKFAANPVTGTGSMTVPIATSPGRSGFGPQLSLSYDSGAGNGPFGFGWSLSLPSITRKTDKGLPQYRDAEDSDVFILSGAEDLVPVYRQDPDGTWVASHPGYQRDPDGFWVRDRSGRLVIHEDELDGYRVRRYRPRIEGLFARIERWTQARRAGRCPLALDLQGQHPHALWHRCELAHRRSAGPKPHLQLADLRDARRQGQRRALPVQGGRRRSVSISPTRTSATAGRTNDPRRTANRYLKRIHYGNRTPLLDDAGHRPRFLDKPQIDTQIGNADWMFEVVFDYGEHDAAAPKPNDDQAGRDGSPEYPWSAPTRSPPTAPASRCAPRASASGC